MKWNTDLTRRIVMLCIIVMASAVLAGSASATNDNRHVSVSAPDSVTHGDTLEITVDPYGGDNHHWRDYTSRVDVNVYVDGDAKSYNTVWLTNYWDEESVYIDTSQFDADASEITIRSGGSAGVLVDNEVQTVSIEEEFSWASFWEALLEILFSFW